MFETFQNVGAECVCQDFVWEVDWYDLKFQQVLLGNEHIIPNVVRSDNPDSSFYAVT